MPLASFLWFALVAAAVVGIGLVAFGARELALAHRILSREPDVVLDAPGGGPVELEGTVVADSDARSSPFTDTACVAYEYEVQEKRTRTQSTGKTTTTQTYWETIASGAEAIPFRLADDTGSVLVDPAGADLRLSAERAISVDGGTEPPERIARYISDDDRVNDQNRSIDLRLFELQTGRDRKFVERRLDVGGPVHVLGHSRYDTTVSREAGQVNAVVGAPASARSSSVWVRLRTRFVGPRFIVSDTSGRGAGFRVALPGLASALAGLVVLALVILLGPSL